jgi:hypothetical protein
MSDVADYQLLPPLSAEEYEALKADIAEHGLQYPIIVDEDGNVLDGHHRARICQELGISPPTEVRTGLTEEQKHDLALSLNLQRRHLSQIQKRELIRAELERNPDRSNRAIGRLLAVDHKTVAAVRAGDDPVTPSEWLEHLEPLIDQWKADMLEADDLHAAHVRLQHELPHGDDDITHEQRVAALREIQGFVRWSGEAVRRFARTRYLISHWLWRGVVSGVAEHPELSSPRSLWRELELDDFVKLSDAEFLGELPLETIEEYLDLVEHSGEFDEHPTLQGLRHFTYARRQVRHV